MLKTTLSFAAALAAVSNALTLNLNLEEDQEDEVPVFDPDFVPPPGIKIDTDEVDDMCCYFYGAFYYQVEINDTGDLNYFRGKRCLSRGMWGGGPFITPYSFVEDVDDPLNDNIESYRCGKHVGLELCNYEYTQSPVNDWDGRYLFMNYTCTGGNTLSRAAAGD